MKAYAKLNLFLDIKGKLPNGYHSIEFVNISLKLHDVVNIERSSQINTPIFDDLCEKVAEELKVNVKVIIEKNIPITAGLGGGSSDAAITMKLINKEFDLGLSLHDMSNKIKDITTDGCYFLYGGTCIVRGIGEQIERIKNVPKIYFVIVRPNINLKDKTKRMYESINIKTPRNIDAIRKAIEEKNIDKIAENMYNAFEMTQIPEYEPVFSLIKLMKENSLNAMMAGAGPSVFSLHKTHEGALALAEKVKDKGDVWVTESLL